MNTTANISPATSDATDIDCGTASPLEAVRPLETAERPETLRRVAIDPVSRVEGHGKVTILLDEFDQVQQVRLHIVEFRGFEKFIQGRPYWEVPVMVQRLCGICPVSHHLVASKAFDQVLGAQLTPSAEKIRRLMHHGQILQSHALHLYYLCSPDLIFGFDSDISLRNIVAVAERYPDTARRGILLRKFGQEVIRVTAGKRIHGTGAVPGGVNKLVSPDERAALRAQIDEVVLWGQESVRMAREIHQLHPALHNRFGAFRAPMMSLVGRAQGGRKAGALEFYDGDLRVRGADGAILFDAVPDHDYEALLVEQVKPWTYMKFPHLRALGPEHGWYRVGPLSRIQNCDFIPTPLAEAARQEFVDWSKQVCGGLLHAPLAYHWTRMVELLHAAETIRELLDDPDIMQGPMLAEGLRRRQGVGVLEAPRGTLIHHYEVGDDDLVTMCNLIVSTTHNNQAMNEAIRAVARSHLNGREITEPLLNHIEVAIRAFDPCLSCATHALGKMPLRVELLDAAGATVGSLARGC